MEYGCNQKGSRVETGYRQAQRRVSTHKVDRRSHRGPPDAGRLHPAYMEVIGGGLYSAVDVLWLIYDDMT